MPSAHACTDAMLVARAFIVRPQDHKTLLLRRASGDSFSCGLWECPGGKSDESEDVWQTRIRETEQETGLTVEPLDVPPFVHRRGIRDGRHKGRVYVVHYGVALVVGGTLALSEEHSAADWTAYPEMLRYELKPDVRLAAYALKAHLRR